MATVAKKQFPSCARFVYLLNINFVVSVMIVNSSKKMYISFTKISTLLIMLLAIMSLQSCLLQVISFSNLSTL